MMVNITMTMNTYIASRIIIDSVTCNIFIAVCATALLDIVVLFLCFSSWLIKGMDAVRSPNPYGC